MNDNEPKQHKIIELYDTNSSTAIGTNVLNFNLGYDSHKYRFIQIRSLVARGIAVVADIYEKSICVMDLPVRNTYQCNTGGVPTAVNIQIPFSVAWGISRGTTKRFQFDNTIPAQLRVELHDLVGLGLMASPLTGLAITIEFTDYA